MKLTFLGTGTSFGVPQIGCDCEVCRSSDPRDKRTRSGALVETDAGKRILIDTPPELRLQLIANRIDRVDAILFTHEHADHIHGIDDVRALSVRSRQALRMYGPAETVETLGQRFAYIFDERMRPLPGTTKPEGELTTLEAGVPMRIAGEMVTPIAVPHGHTTVFGYRIGALGYVTDAKLLPPAAIETLRGVTVLVLNALFWKEHPTHMSVPEAIETARVLGAERTYLTHLTHDNFHAALEAKLPAGLFPAYDGLTVDLT
ncbi:MAG: MBL fold metallo-hydrolase [Gemmatimonadaceae bacterium]|nr:MBL fold metallo-hydrolase [Gemmatimonadaceae bacterium]